MGNVSTEENRDIYKRDGAASREENKYDGVVLGFVTVWTRGDTSNICSPAV